MKKGYLFVLAALVSFGVQASAQNDSAYEQKTMAAVRTAEPIRMDGVLDEPAWKAAIPAADFIQSDPSEGAPATEKTEVRIAFDDDNLYIGVLCYESDPSTIIHNELKYDGEVGDDDHFEFIIDTFNDMRNAFYFSINANGARQDGKLSSASGNVGTVNRDWNGIWDVSARIGDTGWAAECIIPFRTLRFPDTPEQTWGINFKREMMGKREESLWTGWRRNDNIFQLSTAGKLTGLENIRRGSLLELKPFVLAGASTEWRTSAPGSGRYQGESKLKAGLDIKYPLASDLTLDLTTFTDFAQVEADRNVINLTRFDIRYPEKRDFFLEGAEIFEFASTTTNPFYSRRIGLTPDGRKQIPILGGAKVTGKAGRYSLGVINMQTDGKFSQPTTNYAVVRMKRDILERSYIGMIATNYHNEGRSEQVLGVDFSYNTNTFMRNRNFEASGYFAGYNNPDADKETLAGRFLIRYPNDMLNIFLLHHSRGENYTPLMGFVDRPGVRQTTAQFNFTPRPGIPLVRKLLFTPLDFIYYTDTYNRLISRYLKFRPFGILTDHEDEITFDIGQNYEYLDEDFKIFRDVVIPKGIYEWRYFEARVESNQSRRVSFEIHTQWGDFYNGKREMLQTELSYKLNSHFSFNSDVTYNRLSISSNTFDTKEYGLRLNTNISTRLSSNAFIQWNNQSKLANLNFRIHYIPKIGSDVYIVYNHLLDGLRDYHTSYNTAVTKIAYQFTF
ncbi:MAG: DUF5916 domain-containing protein [Candidatus Latescibacterota bacterium]